MHSRQTVVALDGNIVADTTWYVSIEDNEGSKGREGEGEEGREGNKERERESFFTIQTHLLILKLKLLDSTLLTVTSDV